MFLELVSWEQWKQWHGHYHLLPYVRRIETAAEPLLPLFWDRFWSEASGYAVLLESGKVGRYTIAGLRPSSVLVGKGRQAQRLENGNSGWVPVEAWEGAPVELVRSWMKGLTAPKIKGLPDCTGGAVGFWSYDTVRSLEKLPERAEDDLRLPDYVFQRFDRLWIADHQEKTIYLAVHVEAGGNRNPGELRQRYDEAGHAADEMERQWQHWREISDEQAARERMAGMKVLMEEDRLEVDVEHFPGLETSMTKETFQAAVRRIQEYIAQGDVFQVNLSLRQSVRTGLTDAELYEWLRLVNPSPYMGMMKTPDFSLVSASPELLVKLRDGKLSARPIAGTRRRGRSPEEDRAMEVELRSSDKERAEHIMLVDLERNDLGRVSAYGSVKVPELLTVERYSHVMHLVSQVEGSLADGKDALDVVAAVFPGGTITGAPKIRTMEIIEELEPVRRGPYTGSMGWIDYSGNMEFNIIIRTIVLADGVCHIQAGAGIVIDSDPQREFYECLNKAKALWKAVQYGLRSRGT
jgi:para-aminobenzoate synthetase component 1